MTLPTFVCIGPGRAGTSWLYEVFREHPQICMAKNIKETEFFDNNYEKGVAWYEGFFASCGRAPVRGEITNRYIFSVDVAERLYRTIPGCKIIVCLRNPVERLVSNYLFKVREGALKTPLDKAIQLMPELLGESRYFYYLRPFYVLFNDDQFFYVDFRLLSDDPETLLTRLFDFLGVDADFKPSVLHRKVNKSITPRLPVFSIITKQGAKAMRKLGMYWLLTAMKRSDFVKWIFFHDRAISSTVELSAETRKALFSVIYDDVKSLERKTGMDLGWLEDISG